jgi:hypothetical protein
MTGNLSSDVHSIQLRPDPTLPSVGKSNSNIYEVDNFDVYVMTLCVSLAQTDEADVMDSLLMHEQYLSPVTGSSWNLNSDIIFGGLPCGIFKKI